MVNAANDVSEPRHDVVMDDIFQEILFLHLKLCGSYLRKGNKVLVDKRIGT